MSTTAAPAPSEPGTIASPQRVNILGVQVADLEVDELHEYILRTVRTNGKQQVLNVNVHALNLAYRNPWLRACFNQAGLVFCDGAGVILGARILGRKLSRRITYADWMWQLGEFASVNGLSLYFLGGRPGVAAKAAARLRERFPGLVILGCQDGYFEKTTGSAENETVLSQINTLRPDILLAGFGMPLQERWLSENWERLNVHIGLTGGAVFDYISGELPRAPRWMTDRGLEWLGRFLLEPRRLWKRYLVGNPVFLWRVLMQRFGVLRFGGDE